MAESVVDSGVTEPPVRLVVGLGNPGPKYARTRHNAGFLVVDELARRHQLKLKRRRHAEEARLSAALSPSGQELLLMKPLTFMNLSGRAVQAGLSRLRAQPGELLLVHDDIDLPLGRLRFKRGGGAGGQRGVQHTISTLGPDFLRLKLGVGRPPPEWSTEGWVLSRFTSNEEALVDRVVSAAADAVELLLRKGWERAMNSVNGLDLTEA